VTIAGENGPEIVVLRIEDAAPAFADATAP
jgi:hypothetical protein